MDALNINTETDILLKMAGDNPIQDIREEIEILSKGSIKQGLILVYSKSTAIEKSVEGLKAQIRWILAIGSVAVGAAGAAFMYLIDKI